jgi:hypothetical protein
LDEAVLLAGGEGDRFGSLARRILFSSFEVLDHLAELRVVCGGKEGEERLE